MLESNSMRFCTDNFGLIVNSDDDTGADTVVSFTKKALLISNTPLDCSDKNKITKFTVSGVQPADTDRRIIFKIDNALFKFNGSDLISYSGQGTVDDILKNGNTVAQLNALSDISSFAGKKIYPIIALSAMSTADDMPSVKIQLETQTSNDTLTKTYTSPIYNLTDNKELVPRIAAVEADIETTGSGTVTPKIRILRPDDTWSGWANLSVAVNREALACQFQITYSVGSVGGGTAKCNSITVDHTFGSVVISDSDADLYTVVADYDNDLRSAYCVVRHNELFDSRIDAYVNFMNAPEKRELIQIGTGNGSRQELILGVNGVADKNINVSSIELYADDNLLSDYSFNSQSSTAVVNVKSGAIIFASYEYGHGTETWLKMNRDGTYPYNDADNTYLTHYSYTLTDSQAAGKRVANVRIVMIRPDGQVTNSPLGKATGKMQLRILDHAAKKSTIKFNSSAADFDYDENDGILSFSAPKNTSLSISYQWRGEPVTIYSVACGFNAV